MPTIFCFSLKRDQKPTLRAKDGKEIAVEDWMVEESDAIENLIDDGGGDLRAPFDGWVVAKVFKFWKCYKKSSSSSSSRCSKKLDRLNKELIDLMDDGRLSAILQAGNYFGVEPLQDFQSVFVWADIPDGLPSPTNCLAEAGHSD